MEKNSRRRVDKTATRKVVRIAAGKKTIVLGVTGSIAAYKSAELASLLVKQGHDVFVVMTQDATEFISPLTLQTLSKNPVTTSFYDEKESWRPGHIDLADRAIGPAHGLTRHPYLAREDQGLRPLAGFSEPAVRRAGSPGAGHCRRVPSRTRARPPGRGHGG